MNQTMFRVLSSSVVGCPLETIGGLAVGSCWRSFSIAVRTLSISLNPAGSVAGDQTSRSGNSTAMSRGRVATVWPPLRAANLLRMLRRYGVKHHRENQDRWPEEDSLRVGIGISPGAAPACWQRTGAGVEAKNIDFAALIPMRSRRAVATMRR